MSTNPFDDPKATYHVLVNDEGQYSLWPAFAGVPAGWQVVTANETRDACLEQIERSWVEMQPK